MSNAFVAHHSLLGCRPQLHGFTEKAYGPEGTRQPWHQDTPLDSNRALTVWVNMEAEAPRAIRPHDTIRYTLEREHNRKAAISVGFWPAAQSSKR